MFSGGRDTDFRHRLILSHSCVKLDEDTSSALIVRVAERLGAFFSGAVSFGFDVKGVAVVNLLEKRGKWLTAKTIISTTTSTGNRTNNKRTLQRFSCVHDFTAQL